MGRKSWFHSLKDLSLTKSHDKIPNKIKVGQKSISSLTENPRAVIGLHHN